MFPLKNSGGLRLYIHLILALLWLFLRNSICNLRLWMIMIHLITNTSLSYMAFILLSINFRINLILFLRVIYRGVQLSIRLIWDWTYLEVFLLVWNWSLSICGTRVNRIWYLFLGLSLGLSDFMRLRINSQIRVLPYNFIESTFIIWFLPLVTFIEGILSVCEDFGFTGWRWWLLRKQMVLMYQRIVWHLRNITGGIIVILKNFFQPLWIVKDLLLFFVIALVHFLNPTLIYGNIVRNLFKFVIVFFISNKHWLRFFMCWRLLLLKLNILTLVVAYLRSICAFIVYYKFLIHSGIY